MNHSLHVVTEDRNRFRGKGKRSQSRSTAQGRKHNLRKAEVRPFRSAIFFFLSSLYGNKALNNV